MEEFLYFEAAKILYVKIVTKYFLRRFLLNYLNFMILIE
jgi:hypothetical protein